MFLRPVHIVCIQQTLTGYLVEYRSQYSHRCLKADCDEPVVKSISQHGSTLLHMSTYGFATERSCIHSLDCDYRSVWYLVKALAIKNSMVKPYGRGV